MAAGKKAYGIVWREHDNNLTIELFMFREKIARRIAWNQGGVEPFHHFQQVARFFWPDDPKVPATVRFIWNPSAEKMIRAACKYDYLAIAGAGGFGKSETAAIWGIINYLADPAHTSILATSTTIKASAGRIWGKIVRYWNAASERCPLPGKLIDSLHIIRYVDEQGKATQGDLAGITLIPGEKKKESDATGKMQGIHQENVIFIADELSELSEAITQVAFYNLSKGCRRFQFIGISNPASYIDAFGKFAKPKAGWESITVDDEEWETARGICLHFDALKNPNFEAGYKKYEWMDAPSDLAKVPEDERNTFGFWRMWRGFWAPDGVSDRIYSEIEIINSGAMEQATWLNNDKIALSFLDPSFTNGGDRTMASFATLGYAIEPHGLKVLQFDECLEFHEDITNKQKTRSQQLAEWWRKACIDRGVAPIHAGWDATGGGGPLGDFFYTMWSKELFGLKFGGAASELPVSAYDPTPASERYVNAVTEIWYSGKEYLRSKQLKGIDDEMLKEMCQRKLDPHGEKNLQLRLKVMPKSEMKIKYGASPDRVDSCFGLLFLARERCGLDSSVAIRKQNPQNNSPAKSWKNVFSKFNVYNEAA